MTKPTGVGRGKPGVKRKPGAGRKRKLGAVAVEVIKKAAKAASPESAIKKAARSEGVDAAKAIGEEHGWAPDEVEALVSPKAAKAIKQALEGGAGDVDDRPAPTWEELDELARKTLRQVMEKSPQDGPRVAAAKEVRAAAEAARAAGGKKETAKREAQDMVDDDDWGADIAASVGGGRQEHGRPN